MKGWFIEEVENKNENFVFPWADVNMQCKRTQNVNKHFLFLL